MPTKRIIKPAAAAPAVGPYNPAVRIGDLMFASGQIPLDPATGEMISGDIAAQAEQVMDNIEILLKDQGLTFAHIVKATIFLTDLANFGTVNGIYSRRLEGTEFPARSTIQVAALPKGALVEIEIIAHY